MKVMQIHGNDYVGVPERIRLFNEKYPNGKIESVMTYEGNFVRCRSTATPDLDKPERYFVGHAEEDRTQGKINATNATENCETSAVGRVLGFLGIGVIDSIASADEVSHAIHKQEASVASPAAPQSTPVPQQAQSTSHGVCKDCGANKVLNPKTGKVFCEKKCWLNPQEKFVDELSTKVGEIGQDIASG